MLLLMLDNALDVRASLCCTALRKSSRKACMVSFATCPDWKDFQQLAVVSGKPAGNLSDGVSDHQAFILTGCTVLVQVCAWSWWPFQGAHATGLHAHEAECLRVHLPHISGDKAALFTDAAAIKLIAGPGSAAALPIDRFRQTHLVPS